jgi:NAD(P)H-flavin reductase
MTADNPETSMSTNHRGGPPGFVRVVSNTSSDTSLIYPEYSGNRLYQTLGNLKISPLAGLVFPNLETGDVLYVTGSTEILIGDNARKYLPRSNLAVKINVEAARFVKSGLLFRALPGEYSPYNPPVQYLSTEDTHSLPGDNSGTATLIRKEILSPSVARFAFSLPSGSNITWKAGQYVALDFSDELDVGYSHMRDDDPSSLNDDFVRTFTISSPPSAVASAAETELEITIRKVGRVTGMLFAWNPRAGGLEVGLRGIGGSFEIARSGKVGFVAGGVGVTPLLAQASELDMQNLKVWWTVKRDDLGFVKKIFEKIPGLKAITMVFVTSAENPGKEDALDGVTLKERRLQATDLQDGGQEIEKWYLCTNPGLRESILKWLPTQQVFFEDFNY